MIEATYTYTDEFGRPRLRKIRTTNKRFKMQSARYTRDRLYWKSGIRHQEEFADKALFNLPVLVDALKYGEAVFLIEGERDARTLETLQRLPATTSWQGASAFNHEQAQWFLLGKRRSTIHIIRDKDDAGAVCAWTRYNRLLAVGVDRKRLRLWVPRGAKDITAAASRGVSRMKLRAEDPAAIEELADSYAAQRAAEEYLR